MVKSWKHWRMVLILLAMCIQSLLFNWLMSGYFNNTGINIAGEVPEPGSILLLGLGALMLRRQKRKQEKLMH